MPVRSERLVVVGDEPSWAATLIEQLAALGYSNIVSELGTSDAIARIEQHQPELVLLGLDEPTYIDLARSLHERAGIRTLFVTALGDETSLQRALPAHPVGYLLTPASEQQLRITLNMALARARAERAVRSLAPPDRDSTLRSVLERTPIAALLAVEQRIVFTNDAASALWERSREQFIGLEVAELLVEPSRSSDATYLATAKLSSGPSPVSIARFEAEHAGSLATGYFVLDLRDRIELERAFTQVQRSHAVSLLASGVAHDFNNLLGALESLLFLLDAESTDRTGAQLRDLELAVSRGSALIQQLVQIGRNRSRTSDPTDLGQYVHAVEPLLRRLLARGIRADFSINPVASPVGISHMQLEQILLTLMLLAQNALPQGGLVCVRVGPLEGQSRLEVEYAGPSVVQPCLPPTPTSLGAETRSADAWSLAHMQREINALGGRFVQLAQPTALLVQIVLPRA